MRRTIAITALVYIALALVAQVSLGSGGRFVYHIWSVILGYILLTVLCAVGYLRATSQATNRSLEEKP